jgi:hypothetical protein
VWLDLFERGVRQPRLFEEGRSGSAGEPGSATRALQKLREPSRKELLLAWLQAEPLAHLCKDTHPATRDEYRLALPLGGTSTPARGRHREASCPRQGHVTSEDAQTRVAIMVRTAVLSLCVAASLDLTSSFSPAPMPSLTLATSSFLCAPPLQARTTRVRSAARNWLAKIEYGEMQHAGVLVKDTAKSIEFYTKALPLHPLWPFRRRCSVAWRGVAADGLNPAESAPQDCIPAQVGPAS